MNQITGKPAPTAQGTKSETVSVGKGTPLVAGINGALTEIKSIVPGKGLSLTDNTADQTIELAISPALQHELDSSNVRLDIVVSLQAQQHGKLTDLGYAVEDLIRRVNAVQDSPILKGPLIRKLTDLEGQSGVLHLDSTEFKVEELDSHEEELFALNLDVSELSRVGRRHDAENLSTRNTISALFKENNELLKSFNTFKWISALQTLVIITYYIWSHV